MSDDKNDDKPRNQRFKTKKKAHCCRLSVRNILKLKHFVIFLLKGTEKQA